MIRRNMSRTNRDPISPHKKKRKEEKKKRRKFSAESCVYVCVVVNRNQNKMNQIFSLFPPQPSKEDKKEINLFSSLNTLSETPEY